jgi:hypothetical protein
VQLHTKPALTARCLKTFHRVWRANGDDAVARDECSQQKKTRLRRGESFHVLRLRFYGFGAFGAGAVLSVFGFVPLVPDEVPVDELLLAGALVLPGVPLSVVAAFVAG